MNDLVSAMDRQQKRGSGFLHSITERLIQQSRERIAEIDRQRIERQQAFGRLGELIHEAAKDKGLDNVSGWRDEDSTQ